MTSVAIVAGHRITRAGIEQVITPSPELRVVASVPSPGDLDALAIQPDVIVVDLAACDPANPCGVVSSLAARGATLVVCGSDSSRAMVSALLAGASGLVTLDTDPAEFLAAIQACARRGLYLAGSLAGQVSAELGQRHREHEPRGLGRREIETLKLLAHGYTHGQIARRLGLTEATVNTYVKRIRVKLGAGNKAELTRMAIDLGYVETGRVRPALRSVAAGMTMSA